MFAGKFQIGEVAYIWGRSGGLYSGIRVEIVGWRCTDKGNEYYCDNWSTDSPRWWREKNLITPRQYQSIAQSALNGNLKNTHFGSAFWEKQLWHIHPRRRWYMEKR